MSATFLVFPSLLSTMPLTTNSYWLNVVRHVEGINKFHVNHHHHSISHSSWRKFQLMYIWCDTYKYQRPPWSSPPCCPCRPQCRLLPTHRYFMRSDMLTGWSDEGTTDSPQCHFSKAWQFLQLNLRWAFYWLFNLTPNYCYFWQLDSISCLVLSIKKRNQFNSNILFQCTPQCVLLILEWHATHRCYKHSYVP